MDYSRYVQVNQKFIRPNEPQKLCGDSSKVKNILGWNHLYVFQEIVEEMCKAASNNFKAMQFIDLTTRNKLIGDKINNSIQKVMEHGQYILGPEVQELEKNLAEYTSSKHCICVSSGTDSLFIALMALGVGAGDEVVTVPYTWISTAEVIALLGAKPVFVDIRPDTWNMDEAFTRGCNIRKNQSDHASLHLWPMLRYGCY